MANSWLSLTTGILSLTLTGSDAACYYNTFYFDYYCTTYTVGLGGSAIAGIVIGSITIIGLVIAAIVAFCIHTKTSRGPTRGRVIENAPAVAVVSSTSAAQAYPTYPGYVPGPPSYDAVTAQYPPVAGPSDATMPPPSELK